MTRKIETPPGNGEQPGVAPSSGRDPALRPMSIGQDGMLVEARQVPSPNCDARPDGAAVTLVVVHAISLPPGDFGGDAIERFFTNTLDSDSHPYFGELRDVRVSAHFLIRREGSVTQFVPCNRRAWHAGESCHAGRVRCNDFSIGIELEGTGEVAYTDSQYATLLALIVALRRRYPIADVVGHSDIAPGRKTDPGASFDWMRLRTALQHF